MHISGIRAALCGLFLLPFLSTEAAENGLTFIYAARALQPGEVLLVKARTAHPLKSLRAEAFDRKFPAFISKGGREWTALVGIDLDTNPGSYPLTLSGTDVNGNKLTAQKALKVTARRFPTRTLAVEEKYVTPPKEVLARIEKESAQVNAVLAAVTPHKFWAVPFTVPVPGKVISVFGKRNIYNGKPRSPHSGVDFRGATGTPIKAPNAGRIVLAQELYYSGNTVIIDHGLGLYSYLGHMSAISVALGDDVVKGELVGKVGATGRVTGPHLHWTVRLDEARVDPLSLIRVLKSTR
jgi:murein DD-endopeptidase MepM/ murein hydrolase activator NlpD